MSKIIELRAMIDNLVAVISAGQRPSDDKLVAKLGQIKQLSYRRKALRKAPAQSQPMTPELAEQIRAFAKRNQDMTQQAIGQRFRVNAGRVSEVLE